MKTMKSSIHSVAIMASSLLLLTTTFTFVDAGNNKRQQRLRGPKENNAKATHPHNLFDHSYNGAIVNGADAPVASPSPSLTTPSTVVDDGNISEVVDDIGESSMTPQALARPWKKHICKSIIAIGNTRLPPSEQQQLLQQRQRQQDANSRERRRHDKRDVNKHSGGEADHYGRELLGEDTNNNRPWQSYVWNRISDSSTTEADKEEGEEELANDADDEAPLDDVGNTIVSEEEDSDDNSGGKKKEFNSSNDRPWQSHVLNRVNDMKKEGYFDDGSSSEDEESATTTSTTSSTSVTTTLQGTAEGTKGPAYDIADDTTNDTTDNRTVDREANPNKMDTEDEFEEEDDFEFEQEEEEGEGEEFVCELYSGDTIPIIATSLQLQELRSALNSGVLVSAVSTITMVEEEDVEEEDDVGVNAASAASGAFEVANLLLDDNNNNPASSSSSGGGGHAMPQSVTLPAGSISIQTDPNRRLQQQHQQQNNHNNQSQQRRSLASYSGTKPLLIVKVTDINGLSVPENSSTISDKLLGTNGDAETFKSQFGSCSFGNFDVTYNDYGEYTSQIVSKLSAPGVLEVTIDVELDNPQHVLRSAIHKAVTSKLNESNNQGNNNGGNSNEEKTITLPGPFSHVMYLLADCEQGCGWAAYAYVNSWLSVYQNKYYMFPSVSMHEVGHNLNLAHSGGLDGKAYTDHTCLMGNPLFSDDVGDMCFNPAKNYQMIMSESYGFGYGSWYDTTRVYTYDSSMEEGGSTSIVGVDGSSTITSGGGNGWTGKLVGVAEYDLLSKGAMNTLLHKDSKLVLKIESGTDTDYYIGFNRATGINGDNVAFSDHVTIIEAGGDGITYSQSYIKATLEEGDSYTISRNWRGGGNKLDVVVDKVRVDVVPGYAEVRVVLGDGGMGGDRVPKVTRQPTAQPSAPPTKYPTDHPTSYPTPPPTNYPTNDPTPLPTKYPTDPPTHDPTTLPTDSPTPLPTFNPPLQGPAPPAPAPPPIVPAGFNTQARLSTNIVTPNRVADGTMFTVQALRDVTITSLLTYTSTEEFGTIQVYVRDGLYMGCTDNEEGWTLIFNKGVQQNGNSELTRLGPFMDDQAVHVSAGNDVSFYVYTANKLTYQYSNTWQEGNVVVEDGVLKLYAGVALAYGKWTEGCGEASPQPDGQCIFAPRVFSGALEYTTLAEPSLGVDIVERAPPAPSTTTLATSTTTTETSTTSTSTTNSSTTTTTIVTTKASDTPPPTIQLATPNRKGARSKNNGVMFTVRAKKDLIVTGLTVLATQKSASEIFVYTRDGDYGEKQRPMQSDQWTLVYKGRIPNQQNRVVKLDDFDNYGVRIRAGETQSIYVYSRSGLLYTPSDNEGRAYVNDDALVINEGRVTKNMFRRVNGSGKWAGMVRYHLD